MNFLPIAHLELRRAARKPMTYYSRCLAGLLAFSTGLGFVFAGFNRMMSAASAGQAAFGLLAGAAYVLLAAQGMLLTCDCVSLEKREGTLGLLFLTDLNGFDIVAGKLAAQVSRSLYCLMAAFPAFGFCIILGGVGLGDLVMVALGLLNTLFFFAALGILISASVWRERAAAAWGGLALLVLGVLLPILGLMLKLHGFPGADSGWSHAGGAQPGCGNRFAAKRGRVVAGPARAGMAVHRRGQSARAALLDARRERQPGPLVRRKPSNRAPRRHDLPPWVTEPGEASFDHGLAGDCLRRYSRGVLVRRLLDGGAARRSVTILLMHSVLKYQAASQAGRMLAGKRRSGELELLLTTPYGEDEVLRGCLLELKRSLYLADAFCLGR